MEKDFLRTVEASHPAELDWLPEAEEDSAACSVDSARPYSAVLLSLHESMQLPAMVARTIHMPPRPTASALPLAEIAHTISLENLEVAPTAKCPRLSR